MEFLILGAVVGIAIAVAIIVFKARANTRDGVVMDWEGLRFTPTELIEGYSQNARRHPLKGLTARVEDTGFHRGGPNQHRIHVIVEGPTLPSLNLRVASPGSAIRLRGNSWRL
jgi:hypothetical protein